jgi:NADH dehydrogenase
LITGAFGFIGGAVAARLGTTAALRTLTNHPSRATSDGIIESFPYDFDAPARLAAAFSDVDVFVNTYYVRFERRTTTFARAVANSGRLIDAARAAGVGKIVHVSVSGADERSGLPYYRNKGRIERLVGESGVDYTIVRPALVVASGDTLVNNIAYFLRRMPVFPLFGRGQYLLQPMTRDAFVDVMVESIEGAYSRQIIPVAGPRDWTYAAMVRAIRAAVGSRALVVQVPSPIALAGLRILNAAIGDVVLTRDDVRGLVRGYLCESAPLRRGADLETWLADPHIAGGLGREYANEFRRHFSG